MEIDIRGQNLRVGDRLHEQVERQMNFALGQFETWISGVSVHLEDINGPKGGVDKQCRVLVDLKGGRTVKVEDVDADLNTAINRAAGRLGQVIGREVDKRREKKG
jgi:putative sigma-54 modulation protein